MASFPRFQDETGLEAQIASLRKELASLKRSLARQGGSSYEAGQEQLADLYEDFQDWLSDTMPQLRSRARAAGRVMEDNSTAIIVGAAVVGLLAALLFARR
jgi:ElaB/YqjD/DUF883 family membrane-anchored ribosome-binding protein